MIDALKQILAELLAESDAIWLPVVKDEFPNGPGALWTVRTRGYFSLQGSGAGVSRAAQYEKQKLVDQVVADGLVRRAGRRRELTPAGYVAARRACWVGTGPCLLKAITRINKALAKDAYVVDPVSGKAYIPETRIAGSTDPEILDALSVLLLPLLSHGFLESNLNPRGLIFYHPVCHKQIDHKAVGEWVDLESTGADFDNDLAISLRAMTEVNRQRILASWDRSDNGDIPISCAAEMRDASSPIDIKYSPIFTLSNVG